MIDGKWSGFISALKSVDVDPLEFFQEVANCADEEGEDVNYFISNIAHNLDSDDYHSLLAGAFDWEFSSQGHHYWSRIHSALRDLHYD